MKTRPSILVVGAGYVGLATAVFLATRGYGVTVSEKNPQTVESLQRGRLHFREPELQSNLKAVVRSKRLTVKLPEEEAYQTFDVIFVAIDSADRNTWRMRTDPFKQIAGWIGGVKRRSAPTVVLKSTNVLGFSEQFRTLLDDTPYGRDVKLVVSPEFLREGLAFEDTASPWRLVIGSREKRDAARLALIYRSVYPKSVPIVHTDWKSAELIKLAANVYLAHRLSFIHEIADFARQEDLDIEAIRQGIGLDPRIGLEYFNPGLGFGGSCLPKDCILLNSEEGEKDFAFETALSAMAINDRLIENLLVRLDDTLGGLKGKKIAVLGAAFKPETDDTRGSRSVLLATLMRRAGAKVALHDPHLKQVDITMEGKIPLEHDFDTALKGAAAIVIGTAHRRFALIKPDHAAALVRRKLVVDYFRILNRKGWQDAGFAFI